MSEDPKKYGNDDAELIAEKKCEIEGYWILHDKHTALAAYYERRIRTAEAQLRALADGLP